MEYFAGDHALATLALGFGAAPTVFAIESAVDTHKHACCGEATRSNGGYRIDLDGNVGNSGAVVLGRLRNPQVACLDVPTQSVRLLERG